MPAVKRLTAPDSFCWTFPGAPVEIRFSFPAIEALRQEVLGWRGMDTAGILLGRVVPGTPASITITGHQPFHPVGPRYTLKNSERRELAAAVASLRDVSPAEAVGYYRSRAGTLSLHKDDLRLIRSCLCRPEDVFLVLRPDAGGVVTAGFFFWDRGIINSEFSFLEFPLDPGQLRPGAPADVSRLKFIGRGTWGLAAAGLLAAVVAGVLLYAPSPRAAETPVSTAAAPVPDDGWTGRPVEPAAPAGPAVRQTVRERRKRERALVRQPSKSEPPEPESAAGQPVRSFAPPAASPPASEVAFLAPPSLGAAKPVSTAPASPVIEALPPPASAPAKPAIPKPVEYVPPKPVRQVQPVVPAGLRWMLTRDASVQVKLRVDEQGRIVKVEPMAAGDAPSNALAGVAASAARLWRFEPAKMGARPIPADVVVNFRFPAPGR